MKKCFFIRTLNNIHMMFNKHLMNINLVINLKKIEIKLSNTWFPLAVRHLRQARHLIVIIRWSYWMSSTTDTWSLCWRFPVSVFYFNFWFSIGCCHISCISVHRLYFGIVNFTPASLPALPTHKSGPLLWVPYFSSIPHYFCRISNIFLRSP